MKHQIKTIFISFLAIAPSLSVASNPTQVADLLGRDLAFEAGGVEGLGHVGLWTGSKVLEVLDSEEVIEEGSLASFKSASNDYWGARTRNPKFYFGSRSNVIKFGRQQKEFEPSYTLSMYATPGKWGFKRVYNETTKKWERVKYVKVKAKFRCDTFATFSFDRANERKPYGSTPRAVFKYFGPLLD